MTKKWMSKWNSDGKRVFHTNPDCFNLPKDAKEVDDEEIEWYDADECQYCSGEVEPHRQGGKDIYYAAVNAEVEDVL